MTFFTQSTPAAVKPDFGLRQSGRSGLELLGSLQRYSSDALRQSAHQTFLESDEGRAIADEHNDGVQEPEAIADRVARARTLAESDPIYRLERFFQLYVANDIWNRAIPAVEERREEFLPLTRPPEEAKVSSIELDADVVPPRYHSHTEWHLEPGGWDGYDLYGPVFAFGIGPLVFRHGGYAAVSVGADITRQRIDAVQQLPKAHYDAIYEPGCGGVSTTKALHTVHPEARLVGADLSALLLRNGHILAERQGLPVELKQRNITETGEADESFDAVFTYALHHELPPKDNRALFEEMFRILKPGGDIVLSDPPPFRAVDPFQAVLLDWDTANRAEPFFSIACLSDWKEELTRAGFVDAEDYAIGEDSYPWITRARKPMGEAIAQAA